MMLESKEVPIKDLLRKSLLGEELVTTHFHLFSSRSKSSGKVLKPRTLCASNVLLKQSAKYFDDLLAPGAISSHPSIVDIGLNDKILESTEYDYEDDSDLDDEDQAVLVASIKRQQELSEKRCCSCPGHSSTPSELSELEKACTKEDIRSVPETCIPSMYRDADQLEGEAKTEALLLPSTLTTNAVTIREQSTSSRHLFIKDTAFRTWHSLLWYLYTGEISFLPLKSSGLHSEESLNATNEELKCSAKSMYRLARKIQVDDLREKALNAIRENLSGKNILRELVSKFTTRYPEILEMELDLLSKEIETPSVLTDLPALMRRIANSELPHGASIMIGLCRRMLVKQIDMTSRNAVRKGGEAAKTVLASWSIGTGVVEECRASTEETPRRT